MNLTIKEIKMISEISKEVEAKIPEYLNRYKEYGLKTGNVDKEKATTALKQFAEYLDVKLTTFTFVESFTQAFEVLKSQNPDLTNSEFLSGCNWGNIYSYWASFYSFIENELPVEKTGLVDMLNNIVENVPPFWLNGEEVVVINFPVKITFDNNKKLHCEDGAAIEYNDGFKVYSLHGIRVPSWIVETPKDEISIDKVLGITNVEVRLAAIRHVGLHRFLEKTKHKVLDRKSISDDRVVLLQEIAKNNVEFNIFQLNNPELFRYDYELLLIDIEGRMCEFLKMINPSTGEIHVEGVAPGIKTVAEALAFRLGIDNYQQPAFEA